MDADLPYQLFLDLDGVLVDFDRGVELLTGRPPSALAPRAMWPQLAKSPGFYARLGWTHDGKELWEFCRRHSPVILTGLPLGNWAEPQKRSWCARELGPDVEVITCMSREKAEKAQERSNGKTPVLVDDRIKLQEAWEQTGGVFIHHRDAATSISRLEKQGLQEI